MTEVRHDRAPAMTEGRALAIAAAAHLALIAALSLAIHRTPPPFAPGDITPVEFVDIGAVTTSPSPAPPAPAPAPPSPAPDPVEAAPPEPLPVAPAPAPLPQPAQPRDTTAQDAIPQEPPRPVPRPAPAPPAPQPFDPGALEALIDRAAPRAARRPPPGTEAQGRGAAPGAPGPQALATLEAAIRAQIAPCWNPPVGGADVRAMTVVLRIRLNRDGSLAAPPEFVSQTGATEANASYARAFVETARRAVLRCSPLDLPTALYPQWREFELNFDPRVMT